MKRITILLAAIMVLSCFYFFFSKKQTNTSWQFLVENQIGAKSVLNIGKNLTFDNDFIYFSDGKDTIHSLSQKNGQVNWISKLNGHTPFEITQDEASIYIASFDSHIYKLDKSNGYIVWSYALDNQYWPDTEVIFDKDDKYVFFADRGGFLYALDKSTGHEVWKKEFETIENTKVFKDGSIHFGFLKQSEDQLIVDHFPSKTIYIVNKNDGLITDKSKSFLSISFLEPKELLFFDKYDFKIKQNVAKQPTFKLFDKNANLIWSYQTRRKINFEEVYQHKDRVYYLDINNQILSSIVISEVPLKDQSFHQNNFEIKESFSSHGPFNVHPNPHIRYEKESYKIETIKLKIKEKADYLKYILGNFKQLFEFNINIEEKTDYLEFSILHQDNFYKNKFTQVEISGEFENELTKEKIKLNGFYYDRNTWKVRAKLGKGKWYYSIKVVTPFWSKKFTGPVQVNNEEQLRLLVENGEFVIDKNLFSPLGLQNIIKDLSRDGNNLNKIGYALKNTPLKDDYNYLPFEDHLDLYRNKSSMNIFRYGPDNWAPSIWHNLSDNNQFEMDINGNYQGDFITEEAKKRGYKVMMSIFAFYPPHSSKEAFAKKSNRVVLERYLDYVIARYAASVDIWEIANEAILVLEWQNFISDYLTENDPYQHPITTNLEEPKLNNSDLLSIHYVAEEPKNNQNLVEKIIDFNSKYSKDKAKIISEFGFKKANHFIGSAEWLRKFAWIFTFQKTGVIFWNTGFGFYENLETENSNVYLGPKERFYLNNLNIFLPVMSINSISKFYLENENKLAVYSLKDKNYDLFYLLNLNLMGENLGSEKKKLEIEVKKSGSITFINPKTGNILQEFPIGKGKQKLNLPNFDDDLAIKISYD